MDSIPKTPSLSILHEKEVVRSAGRGAILDFLTSSKGYDVVRSSGKVVVFDVRISIQLAFYALVEHGENPPRDSRRARRLNPADFPCLTFFEFINSLIH